MKATDYIAGFLADRGVSNIFEMSGGMITHLLDSLHRQGRVRVVSVHHEQAAAFAAEGAARMTGVPGVALATSGPGATNLLTGIGSCYFDSTPAVFITGQVNRHELKGNLPIRQLGFQETDIVAMARPITKAAWQVQDPAQLPALLTAAFDLALSGRPGPVLLDIPMDVQRADVTPPALSDQADTGGEAAGFDLVAWDALVTGLCKAKRPLILAGGGIRSAGVTAQFRRLVDLLRVPVVNSLMAVDVLPYSHPLRVGLIGSYGNRWANLALGESDFLFVLGSRLDVRQTGADTESFKGNRVIFHIDCEPGELNNRVTGCHAIEAELGAFLAEAVCAAEGRPFTGHSEWLARIDAKRREWPDTNELSDIPGINPNTLLHHLSAAAGAASAFVIDVGQHQMWAAQSVELREDQRFLTSGGMGSMGFALPAAIGAALGRPGRPVLVIAGDGGFQSNIQELETVRRNQLPLKIVIINNRCHGMVRQFQQSYFDSRYQSTLWGYSAPDFVTVAQAYGIAGRTVLREEQTAEALGWLWQDPAQPALLQVIVDTEANVYPKIAFGKPLTEMEPFAKPIEMEST